MRGDGVCVCGGGGGEGGRGLGGGGGIRSLANNFTVYEET